MTTRRSFLAGLLAGAATTALPAPAAQPRKVWAAFDMATKPDRTAWFLVHGTDAKGNVLRELMEIGDPGPEGVIAPILSRGRFAAIDALEFTPKPIHYSVPPDLHDIALHLLGDRA